MVLKNEEHSIQRIKLSFLCNLWVWSKLFIALDPSSIVDFVDWLGFCRGGAVFSCPSLFFGGAFKCPLYTFCLLWGAFLALFFKTFTFFIHKNK